MAAAPLTDRRSIRAASIVQAGDIHESKPGVFRVRDRAGSGTWHYVSKTTCDCEDFRRNGLDCKHRLALANWSAKPAGSTCPTCGAATEADMYYVAGSYRTYRICTADKYHKATRLS